MRKSSSIPLLQFAKKVGVIKWQKLQLQRNQLEKNKRSTCCGSQPVVVCHNVTRLSSPLWLSHNVKQLATSIKPYFYAYMQYNVTRRTHRWSKMNVDWKHMHLSVMILKKLTFFWSWQKKLSVLAPLACWMICIKGIHSFLFLAKKKMLSLVPFLRLVCATRPM